MIENSYLSLKNTNALKGIMAIMVVISHIYSSSSFSFHNSALAFLFGSALGYIPVSVFFFLSGYGVMSSFLKKGQGYIRHFPRNRILPLYLISLVLIAVYCIASFLIGNTINVELLLRSVTIGGTVIKYGWYLQTIIVLYLLFWVCFSLRITNHQKVYLFCTLIMGLYVILVLLGVEPTWYATAPCMALGVLWNLLGKQIDKAINTRFKQWMWIILSVAMGALAKIVASRLPSAKNIGYVLQVTTTAIFFVTAIVLLLKNLSLNNSVTRALGKISLEIYTTQGLAIMLLSFFGLNEASVFLYGSLVVVLTIVLAICISPLFKKINQKVRIEYCSKE